jgi:hypothetical protein
MVVCTTKPPANRTLLLAFTRGAFLLLALSGIGWGYPSATVGDARQLDNVRGSIQENSHQLSESGR